MVLACNIKQGFRPIKRQIIFVGPKSIDWKTFPLDVLWIMVVTITNLGYGDFTPSYWISRSIIAFMSVFGIFQTALIVGVLRPEFYYPSGDLLTPV